MDAITYSVARANLAQAMNRVCEDHAPPVITRNSEQSVVMLFLEDDNALRLLAAVAQLQSGEGKPGSLLE